MSPTTLPSVRRVEGIEGKHVLLAMLAFFGIVFAVNGVLLYQALHTHSGLVAQEPYRKGLHYNERIAASDRQAALGWTSELSVPADGSVRLALRDSSGQPVSGLAITGRLGRPADARTDVRLAFAETAPGQYAVATGAIEPGAWQIDIEVRDTARSQASAGDPVYRERRRLWLKP